MFDFTQDLLVAPRLVENRNIVKIISGTHQLPQAMFYFTNCSRGWLLLVFESREIPSRPDLIQSDVNNYMHKSDRVLLAGRQAVFEQDRGRQGSQRYREKFIN